MKLGGYQFEHVCSISPDADADGKPKEYLPQSRYENHDSLPLNRYGVGPFCQFSIPRRWAGHAGVYVLVVNGSLTYVGECQDLAGRFNTGYGIISPRNCFKGGQETNCRVNNLVLQARKEGKKIELVFRETRQRHDLEAALVEALSPAWSRTLPRPRRTAEEDAGSFTPSMRQPRKESCRDEVVAAARAITTATGKNEFTVQQVVDTLRRQGSGYSDSTIRIHVTSRCCANAPNHHAVTYRDFKRIGRGVYRLLA